MKVYVDEKTKSCRECQFCDKDNGLCEMLGQYFRDGYDYTDCPLQSLSDYTKQVRKEVCEEIKEKLRKEYPTVYAKIGESLFCSDCYLKIRELNEILDQIQGE